MPNRLANLMKIVRRTLSLSFTLVAAVTIAQNPPEDVCRTIVQEALDAANMACSGTTRNQVCYGNVLGAATPADGVTDLIFQDVGDIAAITQIQALELSPLNEADEQWGVALMQLQANLPDTLPGQNVTFLLFGDVTVEDQTGEQASVEATALQPANLRLGPNTTSPIVGSLSAQTALTATGKAINSLGEMWVRARYDDYRTRTGWMLAELVSVDLDSLPDVATNSLTYNPMQAFYFKTGIGRTTCASAPVSGVLVQTPEGAGRVNFNVNGINVSLGSTALLTSPEGTGSTCFSLLSGDADLSSLSKTVDLNPGERSCTPWAEDETPEDIGAPQPFDPSEVGSVAPLLRLLPIRVEIPEPAEIRRPTPVPTDDSFLVVQGEQPTDVPNNPGQPQPTQAPAGRFVEVTKNRHGQTVDFSATSGPDAAESYTWSDGESTRTGPNVTFGYPSDYQYSLNLEVCWTDGECIDQQVEGNIPPCPIDDTMSTSITLNFDGSAEQYKIYRSNEKCAFKEIADFGASNPTFSQGAHWGEVWQVREQPSDMLIREYFIFESPVVDSIPGGGAARPSSSIRQIVNARQ